MIKYVDVAARNKHYRCLEYDHDQEGDLYLVACGMEQCDPGAVTGPDVRDGWHLHVMLSGTGELCAGGETTHPHFGQMFLLKHNEEAYYRADADDPWQYCWVTFNGTMARELCEQLGFTGDRHCIDVKGNAERYYRLVCRMQQYPELSEAAGMMRRGILFEFLALALEENGSHSRRDVHHGAADAAEYVQRAINFIHHNYATIDVSDVINYIGFTRSYFTTLFRRHAGVSIQEYLIQHRMRIGRELLLSTALDVREIAEKLGYENALSFSREFKKRNGVSATEYRNAASSTETKGNKS